MCLAYLGFFDMSSMEVCTSSRQVQKLNVCTVFTWSFCFRIVLLIVSIIVIGSRGGDVVSFSRVLRVLYTLFPSILVASWEKGIILIQNYTRHLKAIGTMRIMHQNINVNLCVQCRHLIPALNVWAARAEYTTARPIANPVSWAWMQERPHN